MEERGFEELRTEGVDRGLSRVGHSVDMRYKGQEYTLTIPVESAAEPALAGFREVLAACFDTAHRLRFGHANPGAPAELVALRSAALGDLGRVRPEAREEAADRSYHFETVDVVFGRRPLPSRIVRRDELPVGASVEGPAVISEGTATTVLPPGSTAVVDPFGMLVVKVDKEAE
jgi:N-methylhydantoinase A